MAPWVRELLEEGHILDASKEMNIVDARRTLIERGEDYLSSMILAMKYEDKPSFIRALISLIRDVKNPILIIDSIEAVEKVIKAPVFEELVSISEDFEMNLVFVSEKMEMTENDYLVDGVIELRREIKDGRTLRKMILHKLRGVEIDQPEYLFTLKDGRFRVFESFSYEPPEKPRLFEPLEDTDDEHFSSGSRSLDEIFGGFPKGSTVLFEIGEEVTRGMYYRLIQTIYMNFLRKGRRIHVVPTLGTDKEEFDREMTPFLREDDLQRFMWIERGWGRERLSEEDAKEEAERAYEIATETRGAHSEELIVMGVDSLYSRYGNSAIAVMEQEERYVEDIRGLGIFIAKPGCPLIKQISNLSDIHIKMENICGVPVIRGLKPKTQYYAMIVDLSEGYPRVEFEKIE